jgi:hypothetical protein
MLKRVKSRRHWALARLYAPAGAAGQGVWSPAGRTVNGTAAVYETLLAAPGATKASGIAWMDTHLLAAGLYSGSELGHGS